MSIKSQVPHVAPFDRDAMPVDPASLSVVYAHNPVRLAQFALDVVLVGVANGRIQIGSPPAPAAGQE